MGIALLFTLLSGLVWGAIWGILDATFLKNGILAKPDFMTQIMRSLVTSLIGYLIAAYLLGAPGLVGMLIAWFACDFFRVKFLSK